MVVALEAKLKRNAKTLEVLGDGRQMKSYTDVDDCVRGIVAGLKLLRRGSWKICNIGTYDATTADRVAEIVIEELSLGKVRLRHTGGPRGWLGDTKRRVLSIEKLRKTDWRPMYSCEEAVGRTVRVPTGGYPRNE